MSQLGLRRRIALQRACRPVEFNRAAQLAEASFRSSRHQHVPTSSPSGGAVNQGGGGGSTGAAWLQEPPYSYSPSIGDVPPLSPGYCPPSPTYCPTSPAFCPDFSNYNPIHGGGDGRNGDAEVAKLPKYWPTGREASYSPSEAYVPPPSPNYCPDSPSGRPSFPLSGAVQGGGSGSSGGAAGGTAGLSQQQAGDAPLAGSSRAEAWRISDWPPQEMPLSGGGVAAGETPGCPGTLPLTVAASAAGQRAQPGGGGGEEGEREEGKEEEKGEAGGLPPLAPGTYYLQCVEEGGSRRYARVA